MIYYSGIGARKTPIEVQNLMTSFAANIAKKFPNICLRTGGADGADNAFLSGAKHVQLYLPWSGFNKHHNYKHRDIPEKAYHLAHKYHPNWDACSKPVRSLHARNMQILFGYDGVPSFTNISTFVLCWTPKGEKTGGTGQTLRAAYDQEIPIFNLYTDTNMTDHIMQIERDILKLVYTTQRKGTKT